MIFEPQIPQYPMRGQRTRSVIEMRKKVRKKKERKKEGRKEVENKKEDKKE